MRTGSTIASHFPLRTPAPRFSATKYIPKLLLAAVSYFVAGRLGLAVPLTSSNVSAIWPAAGIALALTLLWGYRIAPGIALGAFTVNFVTGIPWPSALGIAAGTTLSAIFGGYLFRHLSQNHDLQATRLRDILVLISVALLSPVLAASAGTVSVYMAHRSAWSGLGPAWRVWWLGDAMGVLLIAPLVFVGPRTAPDVSLSRATEFVVLLAGLVATSFVVFTRGVVLIQDDVLAFAVFPFVIWAAIRFRVMGAAITTLTIATIAVWSTALGKGPFTESSPLHNTTLLQAFLGVISVTGLTLSAVTAERTRTEEALTEKAMLLDLANDAILIRSIADTITYWNEGAERLYGWRSDEVLGKLTHDILRTEFPEPLEKIKTQVLTEGSWTGELTHLQRNGNRIVVASRWSLQRSPRGRPLGFLELNTDITELKRAEEALRTLSGKLLTMQDEERRRIARELHDSAGQTLVALGMSMAMIRSEIRDEKTKRTCDENLEMIQALTQELRTISYLLHPPLLDEAGLQTAIDMYVSGFSERSRVGVDLRISSDLGRLKPEVETAIFRLVQESLTNIHRHSGSPSARISLSRDGEMVTVYVEDQGKGMPSDTRKNRRTGVGIQGMRERIRMLGGQFEIRSGRGGTSIIAIIPVGTTSPLSGTSDTNS